MGGFAPVGQKYGHFLPLFCSGPYTPRLTQKTTPTAKPMGAVTIV